MDERSLDDAIRQLNERLSRLERAMGVPPTAVEEKAEEVTGTFSKPPPPPLRASQPFVSPFEASKPGGPVAISESMLGGRVAAWVGAFLVMIGAGVFVKYAYDQGWLRNLGPMGRFIMATGGAVFLLVLGELALRRYGRAAAAGLFAAGIGSLFVIASAGTLPTVMQVYGPGGAALFALCVAVVGVLVARRSGLLAVGVVVVVGAYLVPIFAGVLRMESALAAPSYITAVLLLALVLSNLSSVHRPLRAVALAMHLPLALLVLAVDATPPLWKEAFVFLWWALFVVDAIVDAIRSDAASPPLPESDDAAPPNPHAGSIVVTIATLASVVASFAFAGVWAGWRDPWAWMPAAQAVICLAVALQLHAMSGERRALRAVEDMISTLAILGGALVGVTAALLLKPEAACVAWALMSGATVLIASRRPTARGLALFGALVMIPACAVASWLAISGRHMRGGPFAPFEMPLPGLARTALVFATNWWLPALVAIIAVASDRAMRRVPSSSGRLLLVAMAVAAWGVTAFVVDRGGSGLLVASLLPVAWLLLSRIDHDLMSRRFAFGSALILIVACALAAIADAGGAGTSIAARSIALMLATAVVIVATPGASIPTMIAVAVGLAVIAVIEVGGGQSRRQPDGRAVGEVLAFAAIIAIVAMAVSAIARGVAPGARAVVSQASRLVSLWSATAWLWAALVLVFARGLDDAPPMANLMNATAALVLSALGVALWSERTALVAAVLAIVILVAGSWDLVRLAPHLAESAQAASTLRQALLSAWWATVAVAAVITGFAWRLAPLRWMALAILAITAAKVLIVDLSRAATLARVGALLAVGLLLVGTSIVYARMERRLRDSAEKP